MNVIAKPKNVITIADFLDLELLERLFRTTADLQAQRPNTLPHTLKNKVIACLFYEPSTRTRFSFETAIHRLGGETISTENAAEFSSTIKGETLEDTIRTLNGYVDGIVLRHPQIGSSSLAAGAANIPVFNAGDGGGEHPTQALLDLYTIIHERGSVDGLNIGLVGDLLYGRTIHSLIYLLGMYKINLYCIAPYQLQLPQKYIDYLKKRGIKIALESSWGESLNKLDVVYMTRIQKERFTKTSEYEKLKNSFTLDKKTIKLCKKDAIIMHPLPRVAEIALEIDADPRAVYFKQAKNGLYVRMALLQMIYSNI